MLGLDVSKATLVVALVCPSTKKVLLSESVPNTQEGITRLLAKVPSEHPWVLEPTGSYSLLAATLARLSPAATFDALATDLADTGARTADRWHAQIRAHQQALDEQ